MVLVVSDPLGYQRDEPWVDEGDPGRLVDDAGFDPRPELMQGAGSISARPRFDARYARLASISSEATSGAETTSVVPTTSTSTSGGSTPRSSRISLGRMRPQELPTSSTASS